MENIILKYCFKKVTPQKVDIRAIESKLHQTNRLFVVPYYKPVTIPPVNKNGKADKR